MSNADIRRRLEGIGVGESEFAEILDDCSAGMDAESYAEDIYSDEDESENQTLYESVRSYFV